MSSTQQQKSVDLIEFNSSNADTMDVLDKPNSGVVQKMVMSETASASLIATAVAKLTTSSVTSSVSVVNKSESDSTISDSPSNQKSLDIVGVDTERPSAATENVAAPLDEPISVNLTQVCVQLGPSFSLPSLPFIIKLFTSINNTFSLDISYHFIFKLANTHTPLALIRSFTLHFQSNSVSVFGFAFICGCDTYIILVLSLGFWHDPNVRQTK